jgi:hypothetical protein
LKLLDGWIVDVQDVLTTAEDLFFFWASHGRWHRQSNFSTVASLYSLCKLSCNPPGFLKFSRGKERNIKRLLDPFRSVYFCWYYTFSKIKKMGATLDIYTQQIKDSLGEIHLTVSDEGDSRNHQKMASAVVVFHFFSKVWISFSFFPIHSFLLVSHVSTRFRLTTGVWMYVCVVVYTHTHILQSLRNVCWLPVF